MRRAWCASRAGTTPATRSSSPAQDRAAPDPVGHPARRRSPATSATASCCRRRRCSRRSTSSTRAGVERATAASGSQRSLSADPALSRRARPGARGGARAPARSAPPAAASARPTRTRSRAARSGCRTCWSPRALRRQARGAARLPQLRADATTASAERRRFRSRTLRRSARDGGRVSRRWSPTCRALLYEAQSRGREPAVRGRAGHAARHRPRHLPVRHLEQLRRRRGRGGGGRRPADAALRARHHQGVHDARRLRAVPDRARRRRRRAARARAATSSARPPAGRAAAAGSTPRRSKRSIQINGVSGLCVTKLDVLDGMDELKVCVGYAIDGEFSDLLPGRRGRYSRAASRSTRTCRAGSESTVGVKRIEDLPPNARALPRAHRGDLRRADRPDLDRAGPRGDDRPPSPVPLSAGERERDGRSLRELVRLSQAIERLAAKVHESGWRFNQIVCIARGGAAGRRRRYRASSSSRSPSSSRARMSARGRHAPRRDQGVGAHGDDDPGLGDRVLLVDDLVDSGVTLDVVERHLAAAASRREGDPQRGAVVQGVLEGRSPTTSSTTSPTARGSTSRSSRTTLHDRAGRICATRRAIRRVDAMLGNATRRRCAAPEGWCRGRDSNPHSVATART